VAAALRADDARTEDRHPERAAVASMIRGSGRPERTRNTAMMTALELEQKYLDFFVGQGHVRLPSASLVPANDPTVLFTTAGMQPLVPYLLGEPHPAGQRLTSCQKCGG
jgi:hypothetical protein